MKIRQIMLQNFANVSEVNINVNPGINYLIGENGSCKTTIGLNAVWMILKGLSKKGSDVFHAERFRFVGPETTNAKGTLVLWDDKKNIEITVTRKITKTSTTLEIKASDNSVLDQSFLDDIFNLFTINLFSFSKLTPKEQALALELDTKEYDDKEKELYALRREVASEMKRVHAVKEECHHETKVEPVSIVALLAEKIDIDRKNAEETTEVQKKYFEYAEGIKEKNREQVKHKERRFLIEKEITKLEKEIKEREQALAKYENAHRAIPLPEPEVVPEEIKLPFLESTENIVKQIEDAEAINEAAREYAEYVEIVEKCDAQSFKLTDIQGKYDKNKEDRIKYIQSKKLPFSNMTIDDNGGLLVNGKIFQEPYFSAGEILDMSTRLAIASADDNQLKYVFIPGIQNIDKKRQATLFETLTKSGYQVMVELVDTEKIGDNSILLKEGRVVDSYDENENGDENAL